MRGISLAVLFAWWCACPALSPRDASVREREVMIGSQGKAQMPEGLHRIYVALVKAMDAGREEEIKSYSLPQSVKISRETRPEKSREYGEEINLPFLKTGFNKEIQGVRKEADGIYLIRTNTSYLFFVETKNSGWKLYRYGDKPIE